MSDILGITVDELLSGNIKPDSKENKSTSDSSYLAHSCLLEDVQNRHYQNSIIAYLIIASGILICSVLKPYYKINQLVGSVLCVAGIVYYKFSLNKFKTSLKRLDHYYKTSDENTNISSLKSYTDLFIIITSLLLFIIIISCTFNNRLINNESTSDYWLLFLNYTENLMASF